MGSNTNSFNVSHYNLHFINPLKTGAGMMETQSGFILHLKIENYTGVGTSPPLSRDDILNSLHPLHQWLQSKISRLTLERLLYEARENLPHRELSTLVEIAIRDILSKAQQAPFGLSFIGARQSVRYLPVIGLLNPGQPIENEIDYVLKNGFRVLKLKVGSPEAEDLGFDADFLNIRKVREMAGDIPLILDANGAYPLDEAVGILNEFANYDIRYIEEPVSGLDDLRKLAVKSPIPIAVDESCRSWDMLEVITAVPEIQTIVIKPTLFPDLQRLCDKIISLHRSGKNIVLSSAIDGAVGLAVTAQIAAILEGAENIFVGLDTSKLIIKDLATPYPIINGTMFMPEVPGLGLDVL